METKHSTEVITSFTKRTITINGDARIVYQSPQGCHCYLRHDHARALGFDPAFGENYELINGNTLRVLSGTRRGETTRLNLPEMAIGQHHDDVITLIEPIGQPVDKKRPINRAKRTMGRKWKPLISAIIRLNLPADHEVMRSMRYAMDVKD